MHTGCRLHKTQLAKNNIARLVPQDELLIIMQHIKWKLQVMQQYAYYLII